MKEAVGQTISLQIILVFMIFLNAFLAFSVNYTKAFRVKNKVINELEQNEGLNNNAKSNIIEYMTKVGYNIRDINGKDTEEYICYHGICVKPNCLGKLGDSSKSIDNNDNTTDYKMYYSVKAYIYIDLPIIRDIVDKDWPIFQVRGDTATIYVNASTCAKTEWGA